MTRRNETHATDTAITIEPIKRDTAPVTVSAAELQGPGVVFCPNPKMPLWSNHPRVYIDLATSGEGRCPYCGTAYRLAGGARVGGH